MSGRIFQFAAIVVLIMAALTPLAECFDHWDTNPLPSQDTELHLTAWFAGVGAVLVIAKLSRHLPPLAQRTKISLSTPSPAPLLHRLALELPEPTGSPPPLPLRI